MRRRPYGPLTWLVDGVANPTAWAQALRQRGHPEIAEVVPGHDTVMVRCERSAHEAVGAILDTIDDTETNGFIQPPVIIEVRYDGVDLDDIAASAGTTVAEVIDLHINSTFMVAFCGFSPGFAYLTGLDERLHLPRREAPRVSVPAGSVAIAAEYSCIYPSSSPGGWHLLGSTSAVIWDVERTPPATLQPGDTVRFRQAAP